jgi:hypothetical protein
VFSLSIFRLDFRLARWCSLSIGGGSRPARAIYFLWIGDGRATPRRRLAARAPAPPLWVTLPPLRRRGSASTIFGTLTRAREARADSRSRFHFLVSAAGPRRRRRGRTVLAEPTVPPALPRRPSYAVTAAGRRCLRSAVGGAPACSRSRFSGWISGWRGGALYPLAVAADRRGRFIFYGSAMAERRRGGGWPPAPPRRHFGSRCCARSGIAPRQPFSAPSRARARREPIPDRGFIF